jgi:hypothetical protein
MRMLLVSCWRPGSFKDWSLSMVSPDVCFGIWPGEMLDC